MRSTFDHVHIYAADPDSTVDFYRRHFGAERLGALPTADGRGNQLIILGTQILVVSEFPPGMNSAPPPPVADGATAAGFGVAHLGLNVDDLDPIVRGLERDGVHVHSEPRGSGRIRFVYVSAPDGVVLELTQYVLPRHLAPLVRAVGLFNRAVHATRRRLAKQLLD